MFLLGKEAKLSYGAHALMENRNGCWSISKSVRPRAALGGKRLSACWNVKGKRN